ADPITPLQRTLKSLEPETNYYITIAPGDKNIVSLAGFRDESTSQNLYDGHSSNTIWNFRTADITPPVMSAISISNIDDQGFSFSLDLDEKGKVYYIVVDPSVGGFVAPTGTQVFAQDNTVTGFLAMGTFDVLLPNKQHVNFINGLATNTDFQVYAMAEDVGLVQMNNIDIGISTLNTTAGSSTSGVTIIAPELPICEGDIQPQISPLVIREGVDTDFTNGSHSMILGINSDDFVFENGVTPDFSLSSAGLSNFITTYISSSIIQITYDVSSTASQRDQIVVSGFRFQSINGGSTAAVVKLAGGTSDFIPNINLINLVGYNSVANATFKFDPDVTSVGNLQSALTIEPDPSLILGTNEFYGNGVFFDTGINKYKFNPSTAGNTTHTITLSHTDANQCVANGIKTITVFDENNSIIDLQEKYCLSGDKATGFDTQEVLISATSQDGFRLDTLWLNTDDLAGAIPGAYKANIDPTTGVLIASGNDYLFYPNIAAKDSVDQSSVALQFIGRYVNIFNVADTIELKKVVSISDAPTIFSFTSNISPLSGNTVDFCEDDVDIILTGEIDRAIHSDAEEIIEMVEWSVGSYVPITNNFSSLSDNNAGVGTVFPQIVFNNRSSFPDLTKNIYQYYVRNNITTCESTDTISINVNPKPIASFTDITGCEGQEVKFTNSSTLDGVNLGEFDVNSWQWTVDNENFIGDNSSFEPTETFAVSRNYSIRLDVTTKKGCIDDSIKVIQVGAIPSVDFSYTGVNVIDTFTFTSTTTLTSGLNVSSNIDHLASIRWKFEEGTEFTETGNAGGINHIATHKFNTPLVNYDSISLYAVSSYNCTDSLKLPIIVLQNVVVDSVKGITETDPDGLWVPWSANGSGSWERAVDINTGSELVWVTNANSVYTANDKSYVYSPTYNLSALKRPLIEAEAFWNLEESDGVAFQYSTDNYNVTDSRKSWAILGSTSTDGSKNSGISWYNAINILASPGEQTTNDYGWTGNHTADENKLFTTAKHSLNELLNKSNVTFRMAFSSADRIAAIQAQGFAFNNVRIGERTRTVLLENFTNTNAVNYIKEKDYIDIDFVNNAKEGVEAVIINYHTDFPEPDVFNLLNQVAPSARAAFYNVNSVPYAVLDGDASKNTTDGYFSKWGIDEFQRRSLQLADYQISAVIDQPTDKDDVIITVTLEKNITAPENINNGLLHVALVENSMSEGGITAQYVLKHMLPSATGTFIPVAEMNNGAFTKVITWTPGSTSANTGTTNFEDIEVVIFLQDEINKTIYQAIVVPLINKGINLVTSTDEYFEQNTLTLYPNPARHFTQLDFGKVIEDDYQVKVYDQFGKLIFNDNISKGQRVYELDTKNYLNSLYIIQIESDNEVIERTKLVILE
ncbi:MAG: T9SS type A sorting domain-containing protein, partial [Cyclobacteriaceae bacterium]|nr:T9SS type A sorting domain-containing protein [Cyclobacteriaceae bacterium]